MPCEAQARVATEPRRSRARHRSGRRGGGKLVQLDDLLLQPLDLCPDLGLGARVEDIEYEGPEILQKAAAERVEAAQKAKEEIEAMTAEKAEARSSRGRDSATDRFVKNMAGGLGTTIARSVGNALVRGILGGLTRK